jgi:hypothetical protein
MVFELAVATVTTKVESHCELTVTVEGVEVEPSKSLFPA